MTENPTAFRPPAADDIVLCAPRRTPVGRYGGVFRDLEAQDLAVAAVRAVVEATGIAPEEIDDVILGQASPNGVAPALGRVVALDAGLGESVPGMQLDRRCGSGLQAVATAAAHVASGAAGLIIAGGAESMSRTEYTVDADVRWGKKGGDMVFRDRLAEAREKAGGRGHPIPGGMIETAENLRRTHSVSRAAQDALAARSHARAVAAQEAGAFDAEIVPVTVPRRKGEDVVVDRDEHPRADSTTDTLARLRPVMGRTDAEATVTAGNASGQNDGAAAMVVTTRARAAELGGLPPPSGWPAGPWPGSPRRRWASGRCRPPPRCSTGSGSPWMRWTSSSSTRRSPPRRWPCSTSGAWTPRTSASTRWARASRWATRWGRRARACWSPPATGWRARAAGVAC